MLDGDGETLRTVRTGNEAAGAERLLLPAVIGVKGPRLAARKGAVETAVITYRGEVI